MQEIFPGIVINTSVRFGKPTVQGTRITVDEVLGWLAGGMTPQEIQKEYGISAKDIQQVIAYAAACMQGESVDVSFSAV